MEFSSIFTHLKMKTSARNLSLNKLDRKFICNFQTQSLIYFCSTIGSGYSDFAAKRMLERAPLN